jgi:hypothetical protein
MRRRSKSDAHGIFFVLKKLFFVRRGFYFVGWDFLHIARARKISPGCLESSGGEISNKE